MTKLTMLLPCTVLALSACATPQARVRAGLMNAGLPESLSACMADRMVDRLSLTQLRRLQSLASVNKLDYRRTTIDEYLHKVRALRDTEILTVTAKAAFACAL